MLLTTLILSSQLGPLVVEVHSDITPAPPPRTGANLKKLIEELKSVTPDQYLINDTDSDEIPDIIEKVIGTDHNNSDTDSDRLDDHFEVMNNLDPFEPDSNQDGLPDYYEVTDVLDIDLDNDGIPNQWDYDNDNDEVKDDVDLSPFAHSEVHEKFQFNLKTNGEDAYITLQLRPQNSEHLNLFYQTWDWPDDDSDGSIKDLDNSKEDLWIIPMLNITSNIIPDQSDMVVYGITVTDYGMVVPLFPVLDFDRIVSFTGKIFYPKSSAMNLELEAELIWRVIGLSDEEAASFLAFNSNYVSVSTTGSLGCNGTDLSSTEIFQWIELGENNVALKSLNGFYWSVQDDARLQSNSLYIGDTEIFEWEDQGSGQISLRASNGKYVNQSESGLLYADSNTISATALFQKLEQEPVPETSLHVTYTEGFSLTGFTVEESFYTDIGVFFSQNRNRTISANLLMAYSFLRNATTHISDMPAILSKHNISIAHNNANYAHKDDALQALVNDLIPNALDSLPLKTHQQIIMTIEDASVSYDLSQVNPESHIVNNTINVDLTNEPIIVSKTLKNNMYNTTSREALEIEEVMLEVSGWGLDDNATYNLMSMMLFWNTGEQTVVRVGDVVTNFESPGLELFKFVRETVKYGTGAFNSLRRTVVPAYYAYRTVSTTLKDLALKGWSVSGKTFKNTFRIFKARFKDASRAKTGTLGTWKKLGKALEVIGVFLDYGILVYSIVSIADSLDLNGMGANAALMKATMTYIYALALFAISQIPGVGWLLSLAIAISDFLGGWSEGLMNEIIGATTKVTSSVSTNIEIVGEPEVAFRDYDSNGLDVGDRIEYRSRIKATIFGFKWNLVDRSNLYPYFMVDSPPGSYSEAGTLYPPIGSYRLPIPPYYERVTTQSKTSFPYFSWRSREYETGVYLVPSIPMPNFPLKIRIDAFYQLMYEWKHYAFAPFIKVGWCYHEGWEDGTMTADRFTVYFDVFPGDIDEFASWRSIFPLDHDGDGLRDLEETESNPWRYDTDSDGLNDKYELNIGTDPRSYDTDKDGLMDWYEVVYGLNATDSDTDNDQLPDYIEISGYLINYTYFGETFTVRVNSNPKIPDTDGDGVTDVIEYYLNLNPHSKDTNGDGEPDYSKPVPTVTNVEFVKTLDISPNSDSTSYYDMIHVLDIKCDNNSVYVLSRSRDSILDIQGKYNITKYDSDLNKVSTFTYVPPLMNPNYYRYYGYSGDITIDDDKIYLTYYYYKTPYYLNDYRSNIKTFYTNGTEGEHWATREEIEGPSSLGLTVDESSNVYVSRSWQWRWMKDGYNVLAWGIWSFIDVYSPDNDRLYSIGEYFDPESPTWDKFAWITDLVYNPINDILYVADNGYTLDGAYSAPNDKIREDRVALYLANGTYLKSWFGYNDGTSNMEFDSISSLDVDVEGNLYVLDSKNHRVHKFDPNYYPLASWGGDGTEEGEFEEAPYQLSVDSEFNIYVLEGPYSEVDTTYHIHKFAQTKSLEKTVVEDPNPDTDGDGLTNDFETNSWDTTFTNQTGTYTIHSTSDPLLNDTDWEGLNDFDEYVHLSNPRDPDTDDDGLSDYLESVMGTNINHYDTDLDGLDDGTEISYGSDPLLPDTDGDGLGDLAEFNQNSKPDDPDTDNDGLSDLLELQFNSNPLDPDSDDDYMFDGQEYINGTDPQDPDSDDDNLPDGDEALWGTNPLKGDTDNDNMSDYDEILLRSNPLNNDTDGDGIPDGEEHKYGSNPLNNDTDRDGIPDSLDSDTMSQPLLELVLSYDNSSDALQFVDALEFYANVTTIPVADLEQYKDSSYIVLVGRPDSNGTVGVTISQLLEDCGDILPRMIESDNNRLAVRHGLWNQTQTILMLSHPYPLDAYWVLEELLSKTISVTQNSTLVEFNRSLGAVYPEGGSLNHTEIAYEFFAVEEIDTVKRTDASVYAVLEEPVQPWFQVTAYNSSTINHELSIENGLHQYEKAMGKYIEMTVSQNIQNETDELLEYAYMKIFYRESDLDRDSDGDISGLDDINEDTLNLYFYNESIGKWRKLSSNLPWVYDVGVNTTNIEFFGESYAGYLWVHLSHFSTYGVGGLTNNQLPDVSQAYPSVEYLWPPNRDLVNVTIEGVVDPDGDNVTITITGITSDEPTKHNSKDQHSPDAFGVNTSIASLRAERDAGGNGRVYCMYFRAEDGKGGVAEGNVTVKVPHDMRKNGFNVTDDGQRYDATMRNLAENGKVKENDKETESKDAKKNDDDKQEAKDHKKSESETGKNDGKEENNEIKDEKQDNKEQKKIAKKEEEEIDQKGFNNKEGKMQAKESGKEFKAQAKAEKKEEKQQRKEELQEEKNNSNESSTNSKKGQSKENNEKDS